MSDTNTVLCTAPFTALMVTPERTLRPCCKFLGDLGDLNKQTIKEILASNAVKDLQNDMSANKWATSCRDCKATETISARSVRHSYLLGGYNYFSNWQDGITVLEISSSNVCNLSCAGCNTRFSSGWVKYTKVIEEDADTEFYREFLGEHPIVNADNELLIKNLSELDLTHLQRINFKGGEPLLNTDMLAVLRYFDKIGILSRLDLIMDTSGAIIIDKTINETIALLCKAKQVNFNISVDGVDAVQTYIRYSPKNLASLDNIRKFISVFETNNIFFTLSPTIMVYNIFSLDKLLNWWISDMTPAFKEVRMQTDFLSNVLIGPEYLALQTLQPATITSLINYYSSLMKTRHGNLFSNLVDILKNIEYGGHELHNKMVKYTLDMDKIKGQSVYEAIPELTNELRYLYDRDGLICSTDNPSNLPNPHSLS